jgi:hypothetical protein
MFDQMHAAATTLAAYMSPVRFSSRHCALVARLLAAHAPSGLTDDQRRALDRVLARADAVDAVRKERQRVSAPALREPRNAMITAWSALYGALQAVAAVPRELSPAPAEAEALAWTLFPNGIGLASVDAAGLWSLSRMLLERIEEEGLRPRLAALVNPVNLLAVDAAFATLGIAVGAEGPLVRLPAKRALFEATAAFSYSVAAYARTLAIVSAPRSRRSTPTRSSGVRGPGSRTKSWRSATSATPSPTRPTRTRLTCPRRTIRSTTRS